MKTMMTTVRRDLEGYCREVAEMTRAMPLGRIARAAEILLDCHRRGGTVFVLGNGGSAATASHFACDLAKGTRTSGVPAFRVMPLTYNVPLLTAWGNDTSFDRVFAEQLAALVRAGDVVVAISASGNSPNVLTAVEEARGAGATTIALSGRGGGQLGQLANLTVRVPSDIIEQVEDAHVIIAHGLCVALRQHLRAEATRAQPAETVQSVFTAPVAEPVVAELGLSRLD